MKDIKHPVKSPSRIGIIIFMIIIISSQSVFLLKTWDQSVLSYASLTMVLICLVVLIIALYRTFFKQPIELCLSNEEIILNGKKIDSRDINVIMTRGYFKPVIGILPYNKKIVPSDMVFMYSKDEDRGSSDLISWAKMNNVKMINKSFITWI